MISKAALDIATLIRSIRPTVNPAPAANLAEYYQRVAQTSDPQYAKRLGELLTQRLNSVTKTAELDSSVAVPAAAAALGASAVAGGIPLAKYVAHMYPHAGKGMGILKDEAIGKLKTMAIMEALRRASAGFYGSGSKFRKTAEELSPVEAALLAGGTGLGSGALLAAGLKAHKGNKALANAGKLTGLAMGLPLIYYPAKRIYKNLDKQLPSDIAWASGKAMDAVREAMAARARRKSILKLVDDSIDTTGVWKEASDSSESVAPYVAAGVAGTGGAALGAGLASKAMDKRLPKDIFDYVVNDYFNGEGKNIPKVIKRSAPILGAIGLGLAGRNLFRRNKGLISAYLNEIRRRRGLV